MISDYIEDSITDAETAELEAWLLADWSNAEIFARQLQLHSQLRDALAGEASLEIEKSREPALFSPIEGHPLTDEELSTSLHDAIMMPAITDAAQPSDEAVTAPSFVRTGARPAWRIAPRRIWISAAALLLIAIWLAVFALGRQHSRPTLAAAVDAQWESPAPSVGDRLRSGTLQLNSGFAEMRFYSGVSMIVEGPARFEADSASTVKLLSGKLTASVPPAGHGFTVTCPAATVVDLGTEFGVNIHGNGLTDVDVFKGAVSLAAAPPASADKGANPPAVTLTAGSARRVSADGQIIAIASNSSAYVRQHDFDQLRSTPVSASFARWREYSQRLRSDPDLVAYYTFERSKNASDSLLNLSASGSSLDGVLGGGDATAIPDWSTGRWPGKGALTFLPGTQTHVAVPGRPALDFSRNRQDSSPFTLCAWIKPSTSGLASGGIVCRGWSFHEQYAIDFPPDGGPLRVWIRGQKNPLTDTTVIGTEISDLSSWHLASSVYDPEAGQLVLFVDGRLIARKSVTRRLLPISGPLYIGSRNDKSDKLDATFTGSIDEIAIFKRPLSANDISEMYKAGRPDE